MFRSQKPESLEKRTAQAIFEFSPDGMLLAQNGIYTACNRACEGILGWTREEMIGRKPQDFSAPIQGDGRRAEVHIAEHAKAIAEHGSIRFEWLSINRQGEDVRTLVTLIPVDLGGVADFLVFVQSLAETSQVIDELRKGLHELSQGNLSCHLDVPFREDYEPLRQSFNATVDAFATSMGNVLQTAEVVAIKAEEIEDAAQDLALRSAEQSATVEATASTLHAVSTAISASADTATQASSLVIATRQRAEEASTVVTRTVEAMAGIETSSREISDIVSLIDGIAFQTNLLALNAGVEAARAGDAGRGFAVVASEVRALAQRSADAARDIKGRIAGSAQQVAGGVLLVTETGLALTRIAQGVEEVSDVMSRLAQESTQHAQRLRDANSAVHKMDLIAQSNATISQQASATAKGLTRQSSSLMQDLRRFRIGAAQTASTSRQRVTQDFSTPFAA
jgi:PAS domain S-box-containing protein